MLFISRKVGESVVINDSIRVHVESIQGKGVRLSFSCPEGTTILRQEIHDRIGLENLKAQASVALIEKVLQHA